MTCNAIRTSYECLARGGGLVITVFFSSAKRGFWNWKKGLGDANWLIIHKFWWGIYSHFSSKSTKNKLSSECGKDRVERYKYRRRLIDATQHLPYEVYGRYWLLCSSFHNFPAFQGIAKNVTTLQRGKNAKYCWFLVRKCRFNQVSNLILSSDKIELFSIRKLSLTWNITASWTMIHHPCPVGFFTFVHRRPSWTFVMSVVDFRKYHI